MGASCLVVGSPGVGKYTLIRSLQLAPEDKDINQGIYNLRLDTKYYTADVLAQSVSTECELSPASAVEAVVLVFAANQQSSFNEVRSWAEKQDTSSVEIKLVVANKADTLQRTSSSLQRPTWLEDALTWCYDSGYEYVETAAGRPEVDAALKLEDEQQGVVRVLAALQAHMWPGMIRKQWSPALPTAADLAKGSSGSAGESKSDMDPGDQQAATVAVNGDVPPKAVLEGSSSALQEAPQVQQQQAQQPQQGCKSAEPQPHRFADDLHSASSRLTQQQQQQQSTQQQEQGQEQGQQQPAEGGTSTASDAAASDDAEAELELDMDDFEKLMQQMQGMRSRLSGLPDADRRAAAAEMALKLASLMGLGDEEEGSSEEEDVLQRDVHCS